MENYLNILMVDDDHDDHDLFRSSLKDVQIDGFRVSEIVRITSVYDGAQAMDYLHKKNAFRKNKDAVPDFIVLDLNMPVKDGFEVLKEVRADLNLKQIPVYILTTSRDTQHKTKCLQLNCAGFFSKPSARLGVKEIIETILNVYSD